MNFRPFKTLAVLRNAKSLYVVVYSLISVFLLLATNVIFFFKCNCDKIRHRPVDVE